MALWSLRVGCLSTAGPGSASARRPRRSDSVTPLSQFSDYLELENWLGTAALDLVAGLQFMWVDQVHVGDHQAEADFDAHARYARRRRSLLAA